MTEGSYTGLDSNGNPVTFASWVVSGNHNPRIVYSGMSRKPQASVTRPNDTAGYVAGDVINNATSGAAHQSITVGRVAGGSGVIIGALLIISTAQSTKLDAEVWLFSSPLGTAPNDNAAFAPSDAEMLTLVDIIPFGNNPTVGSGNVAYRARDLSTVYQCAEGSQTLTWYIIPRNSYTPTAQEVYTLILDNLQD